MTFMCFIKLKMANSHTGFYMFTSFNNNIHLFKNEIAYCVSPRIWELLSSEINTHPRSAFPKTSIYPQEFLILSKQSNSEYLL